MRGQLITPRLWGGAQGAKRKLVRGRNTGLGILFSEMPGSEKIYTFNSRRGWVEINVRSTQFAMCEHPDSAFIEYIIQVVNVALTAHEMHQSFPGSSDVVALAFDDLLAKNVYAIAHGRRVTAMSGESEALRGRVKTGRKKSTRRS